jgi:hypothetical protein
VADREARKICYSAMIKTLYERQTVEGVASGGKSGIRKTIHCPTTRAIEMALKLKWTSDTGVLALVINSEVRVHPTDASVNGCIVLLRT